MALLEKKLAGVAEEALPLRLAELWSFFFSSVLPYMQGAFLPVRMEARLRGVEIPDMRTLALSGFRDLIVLPVCPRLEGKDGLSQNFITL